MKNTLYFLTTILLFSCSTNKGDNVVNVSFSTENADFVSWLDIFPDMEMIRLTGEQMPILSPMSILIFRNNIYYVIDPFNTKKVHRFDQKGSYLNSIGSFGRGPNEYLYITDVMIDKHDNVMIYSGVRQGVLLTYSPNGALISRVEIPKAPQRYISLNGYHYHYMGNGSNMDYQLYVKNDNGQTVGQFLPSSTVPTVQHRGTFSLYGETLIFCPPDDNNIYQIHNGKMEVRYRFDFGKYNLPDEYYRINNQTDFYDYLESKTVTYKNSFDENDHCAIFVVYNMTNGVDMKFVMGILHKQKNIWRWFNWNPDNDFIFFMLFDGEYAYFTADPTLLKQTPGMTDRFPLLNTVTDNEGVVILRSKTSTANL